MVHFATTHGPAVDGDAVCGGPPLSVARLCCRWVLGAGRWACSTGRGEQRSGTFNRTPGVPRRSCIGERVGDHLSAGWVPGCMVHAARSRGDVPFHVKHNGSSGAGLDHQARDFPVREAMLTSALPARDVSRETSVRIHPVRNSIYPVRSRTAGQPDSRTAGQRVPPLMRTCPSPGASRARGWGRPASPRVGDVAPWIGRSAPVVAESPRFRGRGPTSHPPPRPRCRMCN